MRTPPHIRSATGCLKPVWFLLGRRLNELDNDFTNGINREIHGHAGLQT